MAKGGGKDSETGAHEQGGGGEADEVQFQAGRSGGFEQGEQGEDGDCAAEEVDGDRLQARQLAAGTVEGGEDGGQPEEVGKVEEGRGHRLFCERVFQGGEWNCPAWGSCNSRGGGLFSYDSSSGSRMMLAIA